MRYIVCFSCYSLLNYNAIEVVENHAFIDAEIAKLSLKGNKLLRIIEPSAFEGLQSLRDLDLSETAISQMPTAGLKDLEILRLQDTDSLKMFPSIYNFEYLRVAWLTYPYHCCAFQFPAMHHPEEFIKHERFVALIHNKYCNGDSPIHLLRRRDSEDFGRLVFSPDNMTHQRHSPDWGALDRGFDRPDPVQSGADGVFHQSTVSLSPRLIQAYCGNLSRSPRDVACHPAPDAFNPCEDLMGNWVAALVGNLAVLLVLLSSKFRMTVTKFLMCNLALADLCMGVYLLLIACMDARSVGAYFNHAIDWQRGNNICLPMENRDLGDQVYLVGLLLVNGLAFILICACYSRIYCAISGHNSTAAQSDTTVAKRMALLVFTDFACWAGYPLIDVPHTKILLVFFYPLNSCANPYLYALLTKQYRRDLFTLLSRHGFCTKKAARYKGADGGYSTGNSVPAKGTSTGGSVCCQTPCTPEEVNHVPQQRARVAPAPSVVKPRSGSTDGIVGPRGSPHPLRNSNTRLNLSGEQEMILRRVLDHPGTDPTPVFIHADVDSPL
ncbi:hypothetical protein L9F63_000667 [Diploptera punctata]|uniref:G-protein coupled receptors family 1 profile domain-containing protein n=1 Tax=Diploptera punctata TaxID=6984 RepID=A0AAD8ET74_DIPPU|nr:hypothetical protein L9F63_000667 [Diploptera punctata]